MASLVVFSVLLAGCTSEKSNTNVVNNENLKTGVLKITSNPSGAKILVNNEFKGITPLDLTLKEGMYNIKIIKDNYEDYTTSITIKADNTETINAELKEIIKTGTLTIDSEPSGVNIYIDGEYKGVTPLTTTLEVGSHIINISKEGYENYTQTITITDGATKVITPKLKKIITNGTLYITSNPSNAKIIIITKDEALNYEEGDKLHPINKIGDTTPISISLKPGEYYILISKEGYKLFGKYVTVEDGKTTHINANLEKEPIGTYKNPAKVGDVVRLETSSIYGSKVYDVSVVRYMRGSEVDSLIKNANMFNPEPKSGYEYLLVKVKVKYVSGDDSDYISSYNFKAYCNGVGYSEAFAVLPDAYSELRGVELMPGGEISGWILYEVPKYKDVLIEYAPLISSSSCYIKLD
jgi:hypothetical protein